jgi:transposase
MADCIMVGCDLHDRSMLLKIAVGSGKSVVRSWGTDSLARLAMIDDLRRRGESSAAVRIVFAYEACGFGWRLHDELTQAGIECHVLAPSKMARSPKHRKGKTDEKDAQIILDIVRSHVLAGVAMPSVWVPDLATRDDRQLVRRRLAVAEDSSSAQVRLRWLLKGNGITEAPAIPWTQAYWQWLEKLRDGELPPGAGAALGSLMRQIEWLGTEIKQLDIQVKALSLTARYATAVQTLRRRKGVGVLTAMVFLTEMGDMSRFSNRQQVGAFLGLAPSSHESGQTDDRKGHITHQGPARVRKVLCQAVWSRLRVDDNERAAYERIVGRNPKHKKIAVVARMRTLGVMLWHDGLEAQTAMRSACRAAATARLSPQSSGNSMGPHGGNRPPCMALPQTTTARQDPIAAVPIDFPLRPLDKLKRRPSDCDEQAIAMNERL